MTSLQFDKEKRKRKKTYATFIIAFVCFSILLAAASFLILLKSVNFKLSNLVDRKTTAVTEETSSESQSAVTTYSGSANVLAICSDSSKNLRFFGIMFMDMNSKQISVYSEEPETKIIHNGKETTFAEVYSSGGAAGLVQAVEEYRGVKLDRFFDVTQTNFKSIVSYLGDAVITSDEKLNVKKDDYVLILEKATRFSIISDILTQRAEALFLQACLIIILTAASLTPTRLHSISL